MVEPDVKTIKLTNLVAEYTPSLFSDSDNEMDPPSLFEAIAGSFNITQDRLTRSRMAGDPPDILLTPKLSRIKEGKACVERMLPEIRHVFDSD